LPVNTVVFAFGDEEVIVEVEPEGGFTVFQVRAELQLLPLRGTIQGLVSAERVPDIVRKVNAALQLSETGPVVYVSFGLLTLENPFPVVGLGQPCSDLVSTVKPELGFTLITAWAFGETVWSGVGEPPLPGVAVAVTCNPLTV
jgi:hypothetical protein